jgi:hypothetical protein
MRKTLFAGVVTTLLLVLSLFPIFKSDAAYAPDQKGSYKVGPPIRTGPLPDYDIRLIDQKEFADYDLSVPDSAKATTRSVTVQSRASAVDQFRASLRANQAARLRATINETGAMKNFFVEGGTLSEPQSDTADNIARNFLNDNNPLFALSRGDVSELAVLNEDIDAGTHFLSYMQTVGGIKVFEGDVRVVVNRNGEVLSVREGFLISGQDVSVNPELTESQGIAKAFEYSGRRVDPHFAQTYARAASSEMSHFANPISPDREEVLSELNVLRVGDTARLAWHVFADVGPNAWYELLVDANTGELLLRHNLYIDAAQVPRSLLDNWFLLWATQPSTPRRDGWERRLLRPAITSKRTWTQTPTMLLTTTTAVDSPLVMPQRQTRISHFHFQRQWIRGPNKPQ